MSDLASRPRLLLRRLHQIMAGPGTAQDRLNQLVRVIAQNMVAEVCSIYLTRAGEVLELFATEGLKQAAVHKTRIQYGQGLVGHIAQRGNPLNLSEAASHPKFVYFPETGEEIYHSFLGVPIIRNGRVHGVVAVQNVRPRHYDDEEVEALQTVAMVTAELLNSGDLVDPEEVTKSPETAGVPVTLDGRKLSDGLGQGVAVFHEPVVEITRIVADDSDEEERRLDDAFDTMKAEFDRMIEQPEIGHGEHREVLETFRLFALDRGWRRRIKEAIASGLTAEAAVKRVQQQNRMRISQATDGYLRDRLSDLEDLSNRLVRILVGRVGEDARVKLSEDSIVFARTMGPAELLDYDRKFLKGVVLADGSPTSHVAIIARALDLPMMGGVRDIKDRVDPNDPIILDGEAGHVFVRPREDILDSYRQSLEIRQARAAEYAAQRVLPAETLEGERVELLMNAGLLIDLPALESVGADGIGLFRTEFQFMVGSTLPKIEAQVELYGKVLDAAGDKPVVFRTLDIGGDKTVPFLPKMEEENPAMGWRAIRVALDRPVLLRYQLRALMTAAADRELRVMFPMIADVAEFVAAKSIAMKELARLERLGQPRPSSLKIGTMMEVPSLAFQLPALLEKTDFIAIGTNDLLQFFFACDRSNPMLADRYDLLSPAVLNFIRSVIVACDEAGVPVSVCGEMGGKSLEAMALVGLGVRRLSMSPSSLGPVKRMIRSLELERLKDFLVPALRASDHSLRDILGNFARDHDIIL